MKGVVHSEGSFLHIFTTVDSATLCTVVEKKKGKVVFRGGPFLNIIVLKTEVCVTQEMSTISYFFSFSCTIYCL